MFLLWPTIATYVQARVRKASVRNNPTTTNGTASPVAVTTVTPNETAVAGAAAAANAGQWHTLQLPLCFRQRRSAALSMPLALANTAGIVPGNCGVDAAATAAAAAEDEEEEEEEELYLRVGVSTAAVAALTGLRCWP